MIKRYTLLAAVATVAAIGAAEARDQINIVGSSTVYPFATVVAENFGRTQGFKTPKIESTGSGGGLKLFCNGVGVEHPDVTNSSRRIKKSEVETCAKNGVAEIIEVPIGFDGIVLANSKKSARMSITREQIFLALAKTVPAGGKSDGALVANPFKTWNEIDPRLPNKKIEVMGPPPTSGTRDAFVELVMEESCNKFDTIKALGDSDKKMHKSVCASVREDGAYIEAGENDNLIVQKLESNPNAYGIFGYSFLDQNADKLQGSVVGGAEPTFENISSAKYPVSRTLFFYVKAAHIGTVPGIMEYVKEFTSDKAWGPNGYLAERGLIPMPDAQRQKVAKEAMAKTPLSM